MDSTTARGATTNDLSNALPISEYTSLLNSLTAQRPAPAPQPHPLPNNPNQPSSSPSSHAFNPNTNNAAVAAAAAATAAGVPVAPNDIQGQSFAAAAVAVAQQPPAEYHNAPPALPPHSASTSLPPQSYPTDVNARASDFLFIPNQEQAHPSYPFHALQPPQKPLAVSAPDMVNSMARSQGLVPPVTGPTGPVTTPSSSLAPASGKSIPVYPAPHNQLFSQQQQPYHAQLAPQIAADRVHATATAAAAAASASPGVHHPQSRSLLQPSAPYLPQPDSRYPQPVLPGQSNPTNYILQQAQQLVGATDEFSQGQMRSHDPRASAMVGFPTQQFDMHRYSSVAHSAAPSLTTFPLAPSNPADVQSNPDPNALLATGQPRNDPIYKPLVPRSAISTDNLPPPLSNAPAYSKAPTLGAAQSNPSAATAVAAAPTNTTTNPNPNAPPDDAANTNITRKNSKHKPVPTIKKAPRIVSSAASNALTAAVANQPAEGVPSTFVQDAVTGSTADIDGSLIERLRGFSHVNQQQLPPPPPGLQQHHQSKQPMLLPQGANLPANLPPNLFPSPLEQPGIAPAPTLNHDPYRVQTIRRQAAPRDPTVAPMMPAQYGLPMGAVRVAAPLTTAGSRGRSRGQVTTQSTPERPFKCKYCNASFGRRDNMQKHERSIHMGERPFVCEICSYAFQKKDHKDKHVRTVHLKERPYQCTLCESRFGQKSDLTKHIRTVHQRIKPFKCEHCGLSFGHRGNKLRHVFVVHQKRKPHVCRICNQAFGERSNLAKHSLAVHKLALK